MCAEKLHTQGDFDPSLYPLALSYSHGKLADHAKISFTLAKDNMVTRI